MNPKWQPFVKTALIGTQRESLPRIPAVSPLTDLLAQIDTTEPESALLSMAGVMALHEQAGITPVKITPTQSATPLTDEKPEPPVHIARRLSRILKGHYGGVLPEFLKALHDAGYRVPTAYLPNLLEKGERTLTIRPFLLPVLGQRGHQLAAKNAKWAYGVLNKATCHTIAAQWHQTEPGKRYTLLKQLREIAPEKGLQTLETTWRSETDIVRSQLIKVLNINISITDEPFLERALDDRNNLVRNKAAELLTYLPDSRLCRRMSGHARDVLNWTPNLKTKITIRFPKLISNTMVRDGILNHLKMDRVRLRTRQLIQIVNGVPLSHWTEHWKVTPDAIIKALPSTNWTRTLTTAFTTATFRQQNVVWAKAILENIGIRDQTARLVSILPENECRKLIEKISNQFKKYPSLEKSSEARLILSHWTHQWDEEITLFWIRTFANYMTSNSKGHRSDQSFNIVARKLSKLCPPSLNDEAIAQFTSDTIHPAWKKTADDIIDMISFRHEMITEIKEAALKNNHLSPGHE